MCAANKQGLPDAKLGWLFFPEVQGGKGKASDIDGAVYGWLVLKDAPKIGFTKDRDNEDYSQAMEGKRPLRRQPENHHFGSRIMLAITAGAFQLVTWVATKSLFVFVQESPIP